MPKLIITIGNIGTGKSTYIKKYVEKGYVVISKDLLRYAIGGGKYIYNPDYEPIIFGTEIDMFKRFASLGFDIIIDGTGLTKLGRSRYIGYSKSYGYKITAIEMPHLPMAEAVSRRMINPHGQFDFKLWCNIWTKFEEQYEEPSISEGFDKIIKLNREDIT